MPDRTLELNLLLKARNLADGATKAAASGLDNVVTAAGRVRSAMQGLGNATAIGLGMAAETLASGGSVIEAATQLGLHMVSELTETFGGQLIAKFTSSSLLAAITAPISALGSAIGGVIAAAIPVGMALLPVILIGALVAAVAVLILNPEIREKVFAFVGELIGNIVKFLGGLGQKLVEVFGGAWSAVVKTVGPFVGDVVSFILGIPGKLVELGGMIVRTIVDGLVSLPGKIADVIRDAFLSLKLDIGPFHISARGVTIDLPQFSAAEHQNYHLTGQVPGHARGGWVGMNGPELGVFGEEGPEYVVPNDELGSLGGPREVHLTLNLGGQRLVQVLLPLVSGELYYELEGSSATAGRV